VSDRFAAWAPPAGWVQGPSSVDGFEVWGPPPAAAEEESGPRLVRCGGCGASAAFDPALGRVACGRCGWVDGRAAEVVGRAAPQGEFTAAALAPEGGLGVDRRELSCAGCGASFALDVQYGQGGAMAATCPYCASNQVAVHPHATSSPLRPGAVLPFAVRGDALGRAVTAWLVRGWMHPAGLSQLARVERFTGVYVPYWTFSADLGCEWRAEVGTERRVRRYDHTHKRWETDVEIDWRWDSGSLTLPIRDLFVPATRHLSATLLGRLEPAFDVGALAAYVPELLAGFQAQVADVPLADGWEQGRAKMREAARARCRSTISERHVRNFTMSADLGAEAWRHVLLPVWVSAYVVDGRTWVVLVDGHTGTVAGQKPVAWWKIWVAMALALSPGVFLGLLSLPLLLVGGLGVATGVVAVVLLGLGGAGCWWLWSAATASEAA
jgi:hypothetical protein